MQGDATNPLRVDTSREAVRALARRYLGTKPAHDEAAATLHALLAERDALLKRDAEWQKKQEVWLLSPEAAQRLEGYREMGRKLAAIEAERDALRAERDQWIANSRENRLIAESNLRERDAAFLRGWAAGREACAQIADETARPSNIDAVGTHEELFRAEGAQSAAEDIAAAIRALTPPEAAP